MESRTQGSRPRPRTQKNFETKAKDRPSPGQGPRTQAQVFKKKKRKEEGLQKLFSGDPKTKGLKIFFSGEKGLQKFFFQAIST